MNRTKSIFTCLFFLTLTNLTSFAQDRKEIEIPNILGYKTLKCDFQMHSIFSDGDVWPTVRVQEAWREGLDVISITDPIEYQPHSQQVQADHNQAYEIAKPLADQYGIVLIRGAEIYRQMPPGHLNAIFLKNANLLERENWWEACVEAQEQGAFLFWSNPERGSILSGGTAWYPEHTRLLNAGILRGIEIYNHDDYFPTARRWADEKALTVMAGSNLLGPSGLEFPDRHRPVTLVFVTEKTETGVKNALLDHRTAVYFNDTIIGERRFLSPIFISSIEILTKNIRLKNQGIRQVMIHNNSDITFLLQRRQPSVGFAGPSEIILKAHRTVAVELTGTSDEVSQMAVLRMFYEISNMITIKGEKLPVNLEVTN